MRGRRKLIVVSNRGPVSFSRDDSGERLARRGGGGLVTALRSLVNYHDVTWIASAMTVEDYAVAEDAGGEAIAETAPEGAPYRLRLVAHDPQAYDLHYNVVSNPVLWFAQHYLWGLAEAPDFDQGLHYAWTQGYAAVNGNFADAVIAELERQPGAAVFFHDYHLYLAPRMVRDEAPDATLAHFMHVPWAQPDYWHVLPEPIRQAIHEGVLANDVVGFHTARWRRNFRFRIPVRQPDLWASHAVTSALVDTLSFLSDILWGSSSRERAPIVSVYRCSAGPVSPCG